MALANHEQFLSTLERSQRPLIVLPEHAHADEFSAAFGCSSLISKLQKPVEIATSGGNIPKSLQFLEPPVKIRGDLPNIRKMILKLNAKSAKVDDLSYNMEGNELHIHITPKTGAWSTEDLVIDADQYRYDLIIAIGGADLESFGKLYQLYNDFFFQTPIINIDHSSANEHFGQINLVDINAVASSEVCHDIFKLIDDSLIDEEVATYFLTGMIHKTKSFRSPSVSPKTLKTAGELIARGARRDEIVEQLYKTRTVETLRLWGRALARLKSDPSVGIVWTMLTRQDFMKAGTDEAALENIIDELMISSPDAKAAAVFYEQSNGEIAVMLNAQRPYDALYLGAPFRAAGTREEALLRLKEKDIVAAERQVITHIKNQMVTAK
ncbi:MAG: hypothetical protein ABH846_00650 [Patescibacteria group bacterium]